MVNPCGAEFILRNNFLHFLSFLNTEMVQVIEIFPHVRQEAVSPA